MNDGTYNLILQQTLRENGNHTFDVQIHLGNMTKNQVAILNDFLDAIEENGVKIYSFDKENDWHNN